MKLTLYILGLIVTTCLIAQSNQDTKAIMEPVRQLFVAMKTNDGELAASLFVDNASLQTVSENAKGEATLSTIPASKLVEAFAKPKEKTYSEPIWNEQIHQDGDYAVVWVDYAFYLGDDFSHCGVDMFQLIQTEDGWKIFGLTDTRRKEGCEVPAEIKARYN